MAALTDTRMAWRAAEIRKNDIAFDLTARHVTALKELLDRFHEKGLTLGQILPQHCRHPALDADLARVFDEIQRPRDCHHPRHPSAWLFGERCQRDVLGARHSLRPRCLAERAR
jgi:hypothetical protein